MKVLQILFLFTVLAWSSHSRLIELRFIGDKNFSSKEKTEKIKLGGLSGLVYDSGKKVLYVVSDDKGEHGPGRYYTFGIDLTRERFKVRPLNMVFLKNPTGKTFKDRTVDFEGITLLSNGNLLLSTEGNNKLRVGTALLEFQKRGGFVSAWPVPGKFEFRKVGKMKLGIRSNQGLESLTSTPDGKVVFTANQQPLYQDGTRDGIPVRVIKYVNRLPKDEYVYQLDQGSALTDIVALDSANLLFLERRYLDSAKRYIVRIYHGYISNRATDVSDIFALLGKKWQPLSKKLILDLDEILPKITYKEKKLDNIEGMCLGPFLKNGNRTLILVSDNNFSKKHRTLFMAFEISPVGIRGLK